MAPPPATPTPRRFLVPKRSQPHSDTPNPAFQPSGQQFHTTPRFSLPSTPRLGPSSSLTPFRHRATGRDVAIDSSPPPLSQVSYGDDDKDNYHGHHVVVGEENEQDAVVSYEYDSVIGEDDVVQESPPVRRTGNPGEYHIENRERHAKRRRISASPPDLGIDQSSPISEVGSGLDVEMGDPTLDIESSFPELSGSENSISSDEGLREEELENIRGISRHHREQQHQPIFQRAPRFRPAEIPEDAPHPEPLPDVFSPRRKGAKYVAGGLAAELRDWLVDVEAGISSGPTISTGEKRDEEWVTRIRVDRLCNANESTRAMTLVFGRQVLSRESNKNGDSGGDDNDDDNDCHHRSESGEAVEALGTNVIKLILAGPGRLNGLGVGSEVRPGVLLGIARPTWEVTLDSLGRWGVACNWVALR